MSAVNLLLDVDKSELDLSDQNEETEGDFVKACEEIFKGYDEAQAVKEDLKRVKPIPGFCIKSSKDDGEKIFINIGHCPELPFQDISEEELSNLLGCDEPSSYRVPMSIGEQHKEKDRCGKPCTAYDIAINSLFYQKVDTIELFKCFIISVALEAVEEKYNFRLNRENCIVLKNKNCFGTLQEQFIKSVPRRLVTELDSTPNQENDKSLAALDRKEITYTKKTAVMELPKYTLRKEPADAVLPTQIVAEFHLKGAVLPDICLDLGEDRIMLECLKSNFSLIDIYLPYNIDPDRSLAEFSKNTEMLKIILPVTGS